MNLSQKAHTRLVALNLAFWLVASIAIAVFAGGPQRVVSGYLEPVGRELGGWRGLILAAAGWNDESDFPLYELEIEPRVFHAAALMTDEEPTHAGNGSGWWFPARFIADGVDYDVDLQRLSAENATTSAEGDLWRIRFKSEERYRGIHELDLMTADLRTHALEIAMRNTARELGSLAPPAGFASLRINGAEMGHVLWSEGSNRQMLERLGYPIGEILSLREQPVLYPAELGGTTGAMASRPRYTTAIAKDDDDPLGAARKLERLTTLTEQADDATFEAQVGGLLNIDKYLRWNALGWLYSAPSPAGLDDETQSPSWYLDPISGLLEPMVQSWAPVAVTGRPATITGPDTRVLTARLVAIPAHRNMQNQVLWRQTGLNGVDLAEHSDHELGTILTRLARSPGMLARIDWLHELAVLRESHRTALRGRVDSLRRALATSQVVASRLDDDARGRDCASVALELEPAGLASIALTEVRLELDVTPDATSTPARLRLFDPEGNEYRSESVSPEILGSSVSLRPTQLAVNSIEAERDFVRIAALTDAPRSALSPSTESKKWKLVIELPFIDVRAWNDSQRLTTVEVAYRNVVTGEPLPPSLVTAGAHVEHDSLGWADSLIDVDEAIAASGLPFERRRGELVLPAGHHTLARSFVVPRGYRLRLDPGVSLAMGPDVSLVSFEAIEALGTADAPVRVHAADPEEPFGVIGVARAENVSRLSHVLISGGSRAEIDGIRFGGQLSFNDSPVLLSDSEISFAHKTDGLSLKRSDFEITRTAFNENGLDGLDASRSRGIVSASVFSNNGDDGIDLAKTRLDVERSSFQWTRDKSISAGTRSNVHVVECQFANSEIAITSKDGSIVDVRDSEFRRNGVGFALYREKPVFSGGSGTVTGGLFAGNDQDVSVEPGSHLELIRVKRTSVASTALVDAVALDGNPSVSDHP